MLAPASLASLLVNGGAADWFLGAKGAIPQAPAKVTVYPLARRREGFDSRSMDIVRGF